jgi:hypothetical protein
MVVDPSTDSTVIAPMPEAAAIKDKIYQLQESLQQGLPNYEHLLHVIHRELGASEDTVHFLTDEEIGIICRGLTKKTGVELKAKTDKVTAKSLKGVKVSDL